MCVFNMWKQSFLQQCRNCRHNYQGRNAAEQHDHEKERTDCDVWNKIAEEQRHETDGYDQHVPADSLRRFFEHETHGFCVKSPVFSCMNCARFMK